MDNLLLEDQLKMFYGLPPHNTPTNVCWGDNYFAKSISEQWTQKEIADTKKRLGIEE